MHNSHDINLMPKAKNDKSVHLLDILKYLLFEWKWFLLSVMIFGGYYFYQYSKTAFMYRQSETVMIKTPMNTPATARITRTNSAFNSVSVAAEILQLRSKELMRQTIRRLNADQSYSVHKGLREYELYTKTPVKVRVLSPSDAAQFSITITPVDDKQVLIKDWGKNPGAAPMKVMLNKEVNTPIGRVLISGTTSYNESYYGQDIRVVKSLPDQILGYFMANLEITQMEEDASILQVAMKDRTPDRAADIITTLIAVYNENSIADKNQIGVNTADFIRKRLAIIERELGSVESNIEQLRTSNQGVDVKVAGEMYLSESRQYQSDRTKLETDRRLVEMMQAYLTDESKQNELIPNNTGLVDANVESQIVDYNTTLLRRNRLIKGSSSAGFRWCIGRYAQKHQQRS
jgi:tyrosine-protein kinase Etk/Wzc